MTRIEVIVSTYERPDALRASLESLADQTCRDFSITVADDGSGDSTRNAIASFSETRGLSVRHVRHEDRGFRLAEIRNRAAAATDADYLVFLDGDCIAPTRFVAAHTRLSERGFFVRGTRVRMDRDLSDEVLAAREPAHRWPRARWLRERFRGRIDRFAPLVTLPLGPLRKLSGGEWRRVTGCNLGLWREDLIAVNGFDSSYVGWGNEDFDLVVRLIRGGVKRKEGRHAVPVLHLWHAEGEESPDNTRRFEERLESPSIRAAEGIDRFV
ncbi:MAG: glycosyltransferase [Gemmatimonadota bacterium]|nr:glycosyltransferase [Gemmatimonadota bacterium]